MPNMKGKRSKFHIVCVALMIILLCMPMTGCGKDGKSIHPVFTLGLHKGELYRMDKESMSVAQAKVILLTQLSEYRDLYGEELLMEVYGDKTLEDSVKEDVLDLMGKVSVLGDMAEKYQILLNDEEKAKAKDLAVLYEASLGEADKNYLQISSEEIEDLFLKILLADKVYDELANENALEISDDDARVVVIKHIFLRTTGTDGSGNIVAMGQSEKAEVYNRMLGIYDKLNQGSNFDSLIKEYSEDDTEQYSVHRGELVEPLNEYVFGMETGDTSPVLESNAGYHIFFMVNKYDKEATNAYKSRLMAQKQWELFSETYNEFAKELNCQLNKKAWESLEVGSEGLSNTSLMTILRDNR